MATTSRKKTSSKTARKMKRPKTREQSECAAKIIYNAESIAEALVASA